MTLETILRTVLHAVAWSALVAFCGVVAEWACAGCCARSATRCQRRCADMADGGARRAVQEAGMWRTRKTSKTSDNENLCQS